MTPQEAEPDLPVSDAGSPAEVCVSGGLLCGPGRGVLAKVCLEVTFSPNKTCLTAQPAGRLFKAKT